MDIEQARDELPDFKWFQHIVCENCVTTPWYCASLCDALRKAKRMDFDQIQHLFAKFNGDAWEVIGAIKKLEI